MGYCHRTAVFNLLFEKRNYRTIASQNISETNCHKFCAKLIFPFPSALEFVFPFSRLVRMGMKRKQQIRFSCFADHIHALNHHLTEAFAGSHDVGGIHGLVRTDQHKPLTSVFQGKVSCFVSANHIVFNGLAGTCLHQRHMLVSSCMVHNIRMIGFKHILHSPAVPDRTD